MGSLSLIEVRKSAGSETLPETIGQKCTCTIDTETFRNVLEHFRNFGYHFVISTVLVEKVFGENKHLIPILQLLIPMTMKVTAAIFARRHSKARQILLDT